MAQLKFVFLGLSITSSWGNGHATTYRALIRELAARGHDILFLERDVAWYAGNRDLPNPSYCRVELYGTTEECKGRFAREVRDADVVVVGSYVPDGVLLGTWVTNIARGVKCFYDIDTPVTLTKLQRGDDEYLSPALIPRYDLYLSFAGGPVLQTLEKRFGAPRARVLYCSVDPVVHHPEPVPQDLDLGYLGTYSDDRHSTLESLLVEPARRWPEGRFAVAGPLYPKSIHWPSNVRRIQHLSPKEHRAFYNRQRFTLNITRADMAKAGYAPSVRLFEAAACGTPIISDYWPGVESILQPDSEILIAGSPQECLKLVRQMKDADRIAIGERARQRVLAEHTSAHRASELEGYILEVLTVNSAELTTSSV